MKFLMRMRSRSGVTIPPEEMLAILRASKEFVNARLQDGTFECAYGFPEGDGFCVASYDSHEALMDDLLQYPQYPIMEWEITPLVDANHGFGKFIEYTEKQIS
jgi:muconolactone delta-isomerase